MPAESTSNYPTLRRARTVFRVLAPLISGSALLGGISMFASIAPDLVNPGRGTSERVIRGVIGLGYLFGAPVAGFMLYFLLRAAADLIDLWVDHEIAAEKTADLVERQLVPAVHRLCQLLEKTNETIAALRVAKPEAATASPEARQLAIDAVREAVRREGWDQARRLATSFAEQFPGTPEAKELATQVEAAHTRKVQALRGQLDQAQQTSDAGTVLNTRDRLSAYLGGTELDQLDHRVARWMAKYLREALAKGQAKEVVHLAERVVDTFGDTTSEGAQVRASLPTMRRGAGLCPDCGQPYDVTLVRCAACEGKRGAMKPTKLPVKKV